MRTAQVQVVRRRSGLVKVAYMVALATLIGLGQSTGAAAGHKSRAEGSNSSKGSGRTEGSNSSKGSGRSERRDESRTKYERRDTRKSEVRKESSRGGRERSEVRVSERKVERVDHQSSRPKKWDGDNRRDHDTKWDGDNRRYHDKKWDGDDRRYHYKGWDRDDRHHHSKWKEHGRHRLGHWSDCAVDRYWVSYQPRRVHCDVPRRVVYCHERPYYEYVSLGIYLPSFWLDVAIGHALPRGYLYYDPYCHETFVTLAGYSEHLHCHAHSPALDVVYLDDLYDDSSWQLSFQYVDRD